MPRIPLEDNFDDIINKAQRGLQIADADLAGRAEVSLADLLAVKSGRPLVPVLRRVARHLGLGPDALEVAAKKAWYPEQPGFPHGFAAFNTVYEDMAVNSYLVWDARTKLAAAFDTGATAEPMVDTIRAEGLTVRMILLTHTHEDHVADLPRLARETGADVWASEREPVDFPGAKTFRENEHFHLGALAIKTLLTSGHAPGLTTFYITGLDRPLAIAGDAIFAGSLGGSATHYAQQKTNTRRKILSLPRDTTLACGHGPLSTVRQEQQHNPFFAR
ncbi:MAG TPA: MBL fold metallo-hydrolase [Opitutus sp.]|nr:MBL fold metallo-hydrolase [Opitutus sp.]